MEGVGEYLVDRELSKNDVIAINEDNGKVNCRELVYKLKLAAQETREVMKVIFLRP